MRWMDRQIQEYLLLYLLEGATHQIFKAIERKHENRRGLGDVLL